MLRPRSKLQDREHSSNQGNSEEIPHNHKFPRKLLEKPVEVIKVDNTSLINCDNIKISILGQEPEIPNLERDSLEIGQKYILEEQQPSELFYGSPALWLKKRKHQNEKDLSNVKEIAEQKLSSFKEENTEKKNNFYPQHFQHHHRSFLNETNERTRNAYDSQFPSNLYKTLISNCKPKFKERKFNNIINHLESKNLSITENREKTEIDEIINTEISETYIPTTKNQKILKNKVRKIRSPNMKETIFLNSLRTSKTHPNSKNQSDNSDKCNIGSKTSSESLDNKGNSNSSKENEKNISATNQSSTYKTINGKILDSYLNKTMLGKIKWKAGEIIAEGSSSIVYKALNIDEGYIFVVKRFFKVDDPKLVETFNNENKIFHKLDHPNIIKFIDSEYMDNNFFIYLDYASGGSIKYIIDKYGPLNENLIKIFLKGILEGLEYLHSNKILHRDLKSANILIDAKGNVKLSDFGCSGQFSESANSEEFFDSLKGTIPWMAPEVVLQQKYGKKADIWSLGCTLIEMVTGQSPWGKFDNFYQALFKIGRSNDIPEIPVTISENFKNFLNSCLKKNPKERSNLKNLKTHPFLI